MNDKKLRLDMTPSEMGMLMGIGLRLRSGGETALADKWDKLLEQVTAIEAGRD